MALPVNIEDLLNKRKVEDNRIEFKRGWNPDDIYHSISAFANDIDNLGGGYILVGVEQDEHGLAKRPVLGVPVEQLDKIQKQMVGFNNMISPYYLPRTSIEEVDGKHVFVIWVPAGLNRPYAVPANVTAKEKKPTFYIREGSSSIVAKGEVHDELMQLASYGPFDEQPNPKITLDDISVVLLRDYLVKVGSKLAKSLLQQSLQETLEQMDLYEGPTENRILRNVAAMMFSEHPEKFFPYTQTEIVIFPKGRVNDPDNFSETILHGSVPQLIGDALSYLKSNVLREFVVKLPDRAESLRYFNYPIQALEEAITNAYYHRDYSQYEPVTITVEPDGITVASIPGPDRSISKEAIEKGEVLRSRRYRNRRLGDFLKELDLTEGRATGIPTIQAAMQENGSPRATIITDDGRTFMEVFLPVHDGYKGQEAVLDTKGGDKKGSKHDPSTTQVNSKYALSMPQVDGRDATSMPHVDTKHAPSIPQVTTEYAPSNPHVLKLLDNMIADFMSMDEMIVACGLKDRKAFRRLYVVPALLDGAIERKYPDSPRHPKQMYRLTDKAIKWLQDKLQQK